MKLTAGQIKMMQEDMYADLIQILMEKYGYTPRETAVIGDRIYTDVKSGLNAGCKGILVLSGESTWQTLAESDVKPDLVLESAAEILNILKCM